MATPKRLLPLVKNDKPQNLIRGDQVDSRKSGSFSDIFASLVTKYAAIAAHGSRRSREVIRWTSRNLLNIAMAWVGVMILMAAIRMIWSPTPPANLAQYGELAVPHMLVALAPIMGFIIGRNAFLGPSRWRSSTLRIARSNRWHPLSLRDVIRHPSFGPVGFMASLIIGMLLNVGMRSAEFVLAVPALTSEAPQWGFALFWMMTADAVILNFFYMVCFAMALRSVALFPKMLLFVWLLDLAFQLAIANSAPVQMMPVEVRAGLQDLLLGKVQKVLISMLIWLPYLILAERVNVTFRHRASANRG